MDGEDPCSSRIAAGRVGTAGGNKVPQQRSHQGNQGIGLVQSERNRAQENENWLSLGVFCPLQVLYPWWVWTEPSPRGSAGWKGRDVMAGGRQRHSGVGIFGSTHRNTFKTIALENLAASHTFPERFKYRDTLSRRGAGSPDCPLPLQAGSLWYPTHYFQCRAINMLLKNSLDLLFFRASVTL